MTGIEFGGFLWHSGRPSSFFVLTATYAVVIVAFYMIFAKKFKGQHMEFNPGDINPREHIKSPLFAWIVCLAFVGTVVGMAIRPVFGVHLGMITLCGAALLVLFLEIFKKQTGGRAFF